MSLVVAEVALAVMLLVSSGLLLRSMQSLFAVTPGFDPAGLLTMQVQTAGGRFAQDSATHRFFDKALDAVRSIPGVRKAALTSQLPLSTDLDTYGVHLESNDNPDDDHGALRYAVSPGYFEAMGIPLRGGRLLTEGDVPGAPVAVLINESMAKRRFAGRDPIGQRLHVGPNNGAWYTIVGVVGDVKQVSLAVSSADAVYITIGQWRFADQALSLVVRTQGDPAALAPAIRRAIWSVDKDQPIVRVATMETLLALSAAERRFALILFGVFAGVALLLAAAGIYGVLSGSVTERTREIGVRSALGASRREILGLVARQGMRLTAFGATFGLVGAVASGRVIDAMLFGISRLDPVTYSLVLATVLGVAVLACMVPAWRATRVDPAITLRAE
jgi:putative ABC transport system permease protein